MQKSTGVSCYKCPKGRQSFSWCFLFLMHRSQSIMRCKSVENEASLVLLLRALPWGFVGVFFFFFPLPLMLNYMSLSRLFLMWSGASKEVFQRDNLPPFPAFWSHSLRFLQLLLKKERQYYISAIHKHCLMDKNLQPCVMLLVTWSRKGVAF